MHAWYKLQTLEAPSDPATRKTATWRGLAVVEARDMAHARALGIDLGAEPSKLFAEALAPDAKRPLKRRFKGCPHCEFLKACADIK
jgi:hypothetical protein